jgi:NADPH:quinone reductase
MPNAVFCRQLGPPETLRLDAFASVALTPGQIRVAVHAAGINFPDILMAAGRYQLKPELPFIPGVEAAGEVIEIADHSGVAVGDKVIVKLRHGGYASEIVATAAQLTPLPSGFVAPKAPRRPRHRLLRAGRSRAVNICWSMALAAASASPRSNSAIFSARW